MIWLDLAPIPRPSPHRRGPPRRRRALRPDHRCCRCTTPTPPIWPSARRKQLRRRAQPVPAWLRQRSTSPNSSVLAVPALIGMFWGAPLIGRELETGTHQSSGTRPSPVPAGSRSSSPASASPRSPPPALLSYLLTWWAGPLDHITATGSAPPPSPPATSSRSPTPRSPSRWAPRPDCAAPRHTRHGSHARGLHRHADPRAHRHPPAPAARPRRSPSQSTRQPPQAVASTPAAAAPRSTWPACPSRRRMDAIGAADGRLLRPDGRREHPSRLLPAPGAGEAAASRRPAGHRRQPDHRLPLAVRPA